MSAEATAVVLGLWSAVALAAGPLRLDVKESELAVKTTAVGLAKRFAHDHVVVARDFSAELEGDPAEPTSLRLSVSVSAASLEADAPKVRKRYGETGTLDASDRKKVTASMLGPDQLDAKRYPQLAFRSTRVMADGSRLSVTGAFSMHGVTRTVTVPVKLEREGDGWVGAGRFTLRTSDFGVKPYSAALGTIRNADEVELFVRLVFTAAAAAPEAATAR